MERSIYLVHRYHFALYIFLFIFNVLYLSLRYIAIGVFLFLIREFRVLTLLCLVYYLT